MKETRLLNSGGEKDKRIEEENDTNTKKREKKERKKQTYYVLGHDEKGQANLQTFVVGEKGGKTHRKR